jgi:hypothetical protein
MLPLFEPVLVLYAPVALGLIGVAAVAIVGMAAVVVLAIRADRDRARSRATVTPIRSRLSEAA